MNSPRRDTFGLPPITTGSLLVSHLFQEGCVEVCAYLEGSGAEARPAFVYEVLVVQFDAS